MIQSLTNEAYHESIAVVPPLDRQAGLLFVAFPFQMLEERRALIADIERLLRALNDADWESLREAQLRDLR